MHIVLLNTKKYSSHFEIAMYSARKPPTYDNCKVTHQSTSSPGSREEALTEYFCLTTNYQSTFASVPRQQTLPIAGLCKNRKKAITSLKTINKLCSVPILPTSIKVTKQYSFVNPQLCFLSFSRIHERIPFGPPISLGQHWC